MGGGRRARSAPPSTWARSWSTTWVLLSVGACAVGPDFRRPPAPLSAAWNAQADPRLAAPALDRLIELSYRQNLPLQIAGLRIAEARAQLAIATGRLFPQLQIATASVSAVGLSRNAPNAATLDRHFFAFQVGFDAAWEADVWGKYRRGVEAESAGVLASVSDHQDALVTLAAEVARTY